jgi:catechol-2,3-dioxygenase
MTVTKLDLFSQNKSSSSRVMNMKVNKIIETCIYYFDLEKMKKFYVDILGLLPIEEERDKLIFLKAGKSMLLIFNPTRTSVDNNSLPTHGAMTPPSSIHFAMEIKEEDYQDWKELLVMNSISIEKEVGWENEAKSLYFRDPAGNLVELITPGEWPVES